MNDSLQIAHPTVFIDQMVTYAELQSDIGKTPSLKKIGDTKLDYSEEGSINFNVKEEVNYE